MTRRGERGAAILAALLVVMLAATIAMFLLAQQSQALTRTARTTARAQVSLYAPATLDWARGILYEAQKNSYVSLRDDWAQNLVAQPLEGAVASGVINDEAGKFNLNNLAIGGAKNAVDWELFRALLKKLNLNPDLANAALDWIDSNDEVSTPGGAESVNYLARSEPYRAANQPIILIEELYRVAGFDAATIKRLAPFVTALPSSRTRTKININTASAELLSAIFPDLSQSEIAAVIAHCREVPFHSIDDIKTWPGVKLPPAVVDLYLDVKSDFFLATLAITGEGAQVRQMALLQRKSSALPGSGSGWPSIIWVKDY
jgi:general secretion pathway protein K